MLNQFNVGSVCHLPPPKYYLYEQTINFSSTAHSKTIREVGSEQLIGNNSPAFVKFNWNQWGNKEE
jgi:hypothetical protein